MKQVNLTIFVSRNVLAEEESCKVLRNHLNCDFSLAKYSVISGVSDGHLVVDNPPMSFAEAHQADLGLCAFDNQHVYDGYIKLTVESLKHLLEHSALSNA